MATVYAAPEEITWEMPKEWGRDVLGKSLNEYEEKVRAWIKENTACKDPIVGEIVKTGVADGYACYMVASTKPLQLIHMEYLDAWHADRVWLRGLRLSDVRAMVERDKNFASIFGSNLT